MVWILKIECIYLMNIKSNYVILMKVLIVCIFYVFYGWWSNKGIKSRVIIVWYFIIKEI